MHPVPDNVLVSAVNSAISVPARPSFAAHARRRLREFLAKPLLRLYNRWIAFLCLANTGILCHGLAEEWVVPWSEEALPTLGLLGQANLALAGLIRQQNVVNLLAKLAALTPVSWPLSIRRALAKVHHTGGIHVGAALSGSLWYLIFVAAMMLHSSRGSTAIASANAVLSWVVLVLLVVIIVPALPRVRRRWHDLFEMTHRLGGWTLLVVVWANAIVLVEFTRGESSVMSAMASSPTVLLIGATTVIALLPWLRLRKVPIDVSRPSKHVAIVHLRHKADPMIGSARAISRHPIIGWHSFANMPAPENTGLGYRMVISRAGDWTGEFIDTPPKHVWVRGEPVVGMANCRKLFRKVLFIATGSGIGPILGHVMADAGSGHLIWVTKPPRATYGDELVDEILTAQPNATIWDTTANGKPDLLRLAEDGLTTTGAEAVIIIANQEATWRVVEGLERQGIPAYGAIWDS